MWFVGKVGGREQSVPPDACCIDAALMYNCPMLCGRRIQIEVIKEGAGEYGRRA
jgi:hypothetical protein